MSRPGPTPTDTNQPGQYTRGEASQALALALACPGAADWFCGWSSHEIQCGVGCTKPQNNLWASGQYVPGATDWNSVGVKNYPTLAAGITAVVLNLNDTNYPAYQAMLDALRMGDYSSETVQAGLRTWCGSTCYSADAGNFISEGQAHANDLFDGAAGTNLPTGTGGGTGTSSDVATSCVPCGGIACCTPNKCDALGLHCLTPAEQAAGTGTPGGVVGSIFNINIAGWNSGRILKWLLGLALVGFGLLLLFNILTEKAASNPIIQGTDKAVAALAA